MNSSLAEIKESIKHISARRRQWDDLFTDIQGLLKGRMSKLPIAKLRVEFYQRVDTLKEAVRSNNEQLQQLKYRTDRLKMDGNDVQSYSRSIEALLEYFGDLGRKVKEQHSKGQQQIAQRQRWELSSQEHEGLEEQSQLIMSTSTARQTRESAQMVLGMLQNQGGKLQKARQKMSSVLKNINLSGNIVNLLKKRSKEDNRLIMWLSLGLVLEIVVCIYYVRPFLKGY